MKKNKELKKLQKLEQRALIASNLMNSLSDKDGTPYLDIDWVVKHIVGLTDEEIKENRKKKIK